MLTDEEIEIVNLLGAAGVKFSALKQEHPADINEFGLAIHSAQNIVLGRAGYRDYKARAGTPWPQEWINPTNMH